MLLCPRVVRKLYASHMYVVNVRPSQRDFVPVAVIVEVSCRDAGVEMGVSVLEHGEAVVCNVL